MIRKFILESDVKKGLIDFLEDIKKKNDYLINSPPNVVKEIYTAIQRFIVTCDAVAFKQTFQSYID
jgi:hypothetical protein